MAQIAEYRHIPHISAHTNLWSRNEHFLNVKNIKNNFRKTEKALCNKFISIYIWRI